MEVVDCLVDGVFEWVVVDGGDEVVVLFVVFVEDEGFFLWEVCEYGGWGDVCGVGDFVDVDVVEVVFEE